MKMFGIALAVLALSVTSMAQSPLDPIEVYKNDLQKMSPARISVNVARDLVNSVNYCSADTISGLFAIAETSVKVFEDALAKPKREREKIMRELMDKAVESAQKSLDNTLENSD